MHIKPILYMFLCTYSLPKPLSQTLAVSDVPRETYVCIPHAGRK